MTEKYHDKQSPERGLIEQASDAIFVADLDGHYTQVNSAACDLLGYSREELLHMSILDVIPAADTARLRSDRARLSSPGAVQVSEYSLARKDGTRVPVEVSAKILPDGRWQAIVRDISARKHADEAKVRALRELETVLQMLPAPISIRSGARYVYTNPAFAGVLGYDDPQELIGQRLIDTIHPDDQPRLAARLTRVDTGRPMLTWSELKFAAKDGTPVPLEVSPSIPVVYREQSCWLIAAHDRRENKRLEAALAAGERMATVGTLAAGVGHEINNPLTYVTMNLELAAQELEELAADLPSGRTRELQRMIAEARDGAGRITKIVRGMNTFARGNRDAPAPLDLHAALETALSLTHHALRQSTQVVKQLAPVPAVFADETRMVQVLVNVLLNAVQAMHERPAERNVITISTRTDEQGRALLEIADNGPGMEASIAAHIFEPFYTTKPVGIGTGLGLSIAHNNVLAASGSLTCETAPGRGALFRLTLPACARDGSSPSAHDGAGHRAERRGRVLLVDDEPNVALSLARMMADEHDVAISGSGQEALAAIDANPTYDLVLCDIMMPNMNGMELFETVRAKHPELAQRFVFMTGGVTNERTQSFLEKVSNDRLEKPFPLAKLLSLVRRSVITSA